MKLGLGQDEVRIVDYTEEWKTEFKRVKERLIERTGLDDKRIEHIGSTSIKDMPAKPIIDILAGVDDLDKVEKSLFQSFDKEGFKRLKVKRPGEIVLAKFADETYQVKTHFIHLVEYQGELWNSLIFFRDYLNNEEDARNQYLKIKQEYLENNSTGISGYTDFKESFVREIINKRN